MIIFIIWLFYYLSTLRKPSISIYIFDLLLTINNIANFDWLKNYLIILNLVYLWIIYLVKPNCLLSAIQILSVIWTLVWLAILLDTLRASLIYFRHKLITFVH